MHTLPCEWHRCHNGWKQLAAGSFNIYITYRGRNIDVRYVLSSERLGCKQAEQKCIKKKKKEPCP